MTRTAPHIFRAKSFLNSKQDYSINDAKKNPLAQVIHLHTQADRGLSVPNSRDLWHKSTLETVLTLDPDFLSTVASKRNGVRIKPPTSQLQLAKYNNQPLRYKTFKLPGCNMDDFRSFSPPFLNEYDLISKVDFGNSSKTRVAINVISNSTKKAPANPARSLL